MLFCFTLNVVGQASDRAFELASQGMVGPPLSFIPSVLCGAEVGPPTCEGSRGLWLVFPHTFSTPQTSLPIHCCFLSCVRPRFSFCSLIIAEHGLSSLSPPNFYLTTSSCCSYFNH
jgi:hypothetical protein